jgi:hypothetical protein
MTTKITGTERVIEVENKVESKVEAEDEEVVMQGRVMMTMQLIYMMTITVTAAIKPKGTGEA